MPVFRVSVKEDCTRFNEIWVTEVGPSQAAEAYLDHVKLGLLGSRNQLEGVVSVECVDKIIIDRYVEFEFKLEKCITFTTKLIR